MAHLWGMKKPGDDSEQDAIVINVHEAKTHFSKLLRRVQNGQPIIIAKANVPIARIVPLNVATPSRRPFGALHGWIECSPDAFDVSDEAADLFEQSDLLPD